MSSTLYIVRHAIAFERDPIQWPDDAERPLTGKGEKRFRQAAAGLRALGAQPEIVLSSPFTRAWQTAVLLEESAGWPEPVPCDVLEAGAAPGDIAATLRDYASAESIAVVGHEPDLSRLGSYLLCGREADADLQMKKGGAACFQFVGPVAAGMGQLVWWATPRMLRQLAR